MDTEKSNCGKDCCEENCDCGSYDEKSNCGCESCEDNCDCGCCEGRKTIRGEEEKRALKVRLNRIVGQIGGIGKMIDEDRYCDDILIQLSAVNKAIKSLANTIVERHMRTCVVREIKNGNTDIISEVIDLFKRFQ